MAGFGSATLKAFNSQGNNSTAIVGTGVVASANVLTGDLIVLVLGTRGNDPPVSVSGTPTLNNVASTDLTRLAQFQANTESIEIWTARATANATADVNWTGSLTGTATRREGGIAVFGSVPASWALVGTAATNNEATATTTHSCGSAAAVADDLRLTVSMLQNSHGGVTAASGYTAQEVSASGAFQFRVETTSQSLTGAWTSVFSRASVNIQAVLREPSTGNRRRRFLIAAG
jgi:hypothetical protein